MSSISIFLEERGVDLDELSLSIYYQSISRLIDSVDVQSKRPLTLYIHEQYGRFGNNVYQVLQALVIARHLKIKTVECCFYLDDACTDSIFFDEIIVRFGIDQPPLGPALAATLFSPNGFKSMFESVNYAKIKSDAEKIGRLLFVNTKLTFSSSRRTKAVFHFRSGDVFSPGPFLNSLYVQPPLSYYVISLDHICLSGEDIDIYVIYEDDKNPCIREFAKILLSRALPHKLQSLSLMEDAYQIASADYVVSSYGTFCEALSLMNDNIRRWYSFRDVSAHQERMKPFLPHKLGCVLAEDGVEIIVVEDEAGEYISRGEWNLSEQQIDLLLGYPIDKLRITRR